MCILGGLLLLLVNWSYDRGWRWIVMGLLCKSGWLYMSGLRWKDGVGYYGVGRILEWWWLLSR